MPQSNWAGAPQLLELCSGVQEPQPLKPEALEPELQSRRGPRSEKPHPETREWPPLATTRESPPPVGGPRTAKIINK